MKIYIQTDIEGIAGFCFFENRSNPSYENQCHRQRMQKLLTHEVNAAVKGAFDGGATEVLVNDSHGSGYNILFEELDERCRIIHGRNCSGPHWMPLLEGSDALVLIGMHAMGGTPCAITPHSLWVVNDGELYLSEGTMAAAIAGDEDIPAIFVSGDDKITAEFAKKIPGIKQVVTKRALSPYQACSLIPARACELTYDGVRQAVSASVHPAPYKISGPVKLALRDSPNHRPPLVDVAPPVVRPTISQAFLDFENAMSWTCFHQQQPDGFKFP